MAVSPEKYQRGRVTWRKDYASDLWSVRVAPEERIEFQPGQYVTLGLEDHGAGKMLERAYSVCSAPHEEELEFFFELVPHGLLTPRLYELKPGADVWMRHRAKGTFTLDGKSGRRNYVPAVRRPWEDPGWKGGRGRAEDVLRKHLDFAGFTPEDSTAYLCGHPQMIENGKGILLRRGFDRAQIHVEVYWMPPKAEKAAAT